MKKSIRLPFFIPFSVLLLGVIISIALYYISDRRIQLERRYEFNKKSEIYFNTVERELAVLLTVLKSLQTYVYIHPDVSRENFKEYVTPILREQTGIIAFGYQPVLTDQQLPGYLHKAKNAGLVDFHYYGKNIKGDVIPIIPNSYHVVVYYIEPFSGPNKNILGFDSNSELNRSKTLLHSLQTNLPGVTPKIPILQSGVGSVISLPVYKKGVSPSDKLNFSSVNSFIYGIVRYTDFINNALKNLIHYQNFYFYLFDETAPPEKQLLYSPPDLNQGSAYYFETLAAAQKTKLFDKRVILLGERKWVLLTIPKESFYIFSWLPLIVLTVTLLISILMSFIAYYITLSFQQRISIKELENIVRKRTKEVEIEKNAALQAYDKLKEVESQLLQVARSAGIAETATNVLHNVGNILNSVTTSIDVMKEKIAEIKMEYLAELAAMFNEHSQDLPAFFAKKDKAKQVVQLLNLLNERWLSIEKFLFEEFYSLDKNIQHIMKIIMAQQTAVVLADLSEKTNIVELLEDSIALYQVTYERENIKIIREFSPLQEVIIDRVKLIQIVVNIIKNAVDSLIESKKTDKQLLIRLKEKDDKHFMMEFIDNGVGIAKENVTKIFSHGFTTKEGSHGFGLHSSALLAKSINGEFFAKSEGEQKGANFVLVFPYIPVRSN